MKLVPVQDLTDEQWYHAYLTMFDRKLAYHMGVDPALIANPPKLIEFYQNIMGVIEAGKFVGWGIIDKNGEYLGHTILDKTCGEWEVGTVLADEELWSSGVGVRATLHALRHAFTELDTEWVVAFTQGKDPKVKDILLRGGFRPFMHFLVMHRDGWKERWGRRR